MGEDGEQTTSALLLKIKALEKALHEARINVSVLDASLRDEKAKTSELHPLISVTLPLKWGTMILRDLASSLEKINGRLRMKLNEKIKDR